MNSKKFYQRFAKDYNLPINVFDEDMFKYYKRLYDFFPNEVFEETVEMIVDDFHDNVEEWLEYCAEVRDNAILEILNNPAYEHFNTSPMTSYDIKYPCGERSVYTQETDGKMFISIDLKKANFQALKYVGVLRNYETYEKFIKHVGGDDYIANSKYLRQVIFGKCNPSRQIKVEKFLMCRVYDGINIRMNNHGWKLYSFNSDELIYEATENVYKNNALNTPDGVKRCMMEFLAGINGTISRYLDIETTVECFTIKRLPIINPNGSTVDAYVKKDFISGKEKLKKASTTFYPQIYKLWKGMNITEKDRVFYFENQLATFNESLKMEEN